MLADQLVQALRGRVSEIDAFAQPWSLYTVNTLAKPSPRKGPVVIAGPCLAESYELLDKVAKFLFQVAEELDLNLYFKASFDKANRSAYASPRGPGLVEVMGWFQQIKAKYHLPIVTDVHETWQVEPVAEVCDVLQIPAFLCRQTDLVVAAAATGRAVNIKKGQFMAPGAMAHVHRKATLAQPPGIDQAWVAITERGSSFGYGDLIVDLRGIALMAKANLPVIFDITHSTQRPQSGSADGITHAAREYAPVLARGAAATGALWGFFLEVHPEPARALSDAAAQLNFPQAQTLLTQVSSVWKQAQEWERTDQMFESNASS